MRTVVTTAPQGVKRIYDDCVGSAETDGSLMIYAEYTGNDVIRYEPGEWTDLTVEREAEG
jgi:hypothetical protein